MGPELADSIPEPHPLDSTTLDFLTTRYQKTSLSFVFPTLATTGLDFSRPLVNVGLKGGHPHQLHGSSTI